MNRCMAFYDRHRLFVNLAFLIVLILVPSMIFGLNGLGFKLKQNYLIGILCRILLYTILAGALNVINGYSGQTCLGIAGFFCIGSYAQAIFAVTHGVDFWINLVLGGFFAALLGLLVALPTLKMSGIYLAIVTLGFSEIVRLVALNWMGLTGGPMGIKGIPTPTLFGMSLRSTQHFYYIFLGASVLFLIVTGRVIRSRVGRAWMAIREDQLAAQYLGVEASYYKALAFMYCAFWAGVAGAVYASYTRFIDSTFFTLDEGWNILSMVIIGGQGSLAGPIVGSVLVNFLTEALRDFGQWRLVAYAMLIIIMMWVRPQGLAGARDSILAQRKLKLFARFGRRKAAAGGKEAA